MTEQEFITKFGEEPQTATKNYATKALGTNYDIKDAFIEFGDNAYDARIKGKELNFVIKIDDNKHQFVFQDDGIGISNDSNLFKLGGTDKEKNGEKIGKYGIGVPGAVAAIATQCRFDKNESVEIVFESSHKGKHFEKHILILANGDMSVGQSAYTSCDESEHGTTITFTNVELKNLPYIIDSMEETFEIPIHKDFNIIFNGRTLGRANVYHTFNGDEAPVTVNVGPYEIYLKYRILSGDTSAKARSLEEAGLRVYDKTTGRLLAKSKDLWKWYGGKECQQTICGLRAAIFIEGSIDCYKKFGILPAKNGVAYRQYCTSDKDFKELSEEIKKAYGAAAKLSAPKKASDITLGTICFQPAKKMKAPYTQIDENLCIIKQKLSTEEIAGLVYRIITLEKKLNRKISRTKVGEAYE